MKIKWPAIPRKANNVLSPESPPEPVNILEAREKGDFIHLRLALSREFYGELYGYLNKWGLTYWGNDKKVVPMFIKYGLSEESSGGLEEYENYLSKVGSRYAAINFQTSEYYAKNQAIVMGLRTHLEENKSLKRRLKAIGLTNDMSEDVWDKWDENHINELYRKYVFGK